MANFIPGIAQSRLFWDWRTARSSVLRDDVWARQTEALFDSAVDVEALQRSGLLDTRSITASTPQHPFDDILFRIDVGVAKGAADNKRSGASARLLTRKIRRLTVSEQMLARYDRWHKDVQRRQFKDIAERFADVQNALRKRRLIVAEQRLARELAAIGSWVLTHPAVIQRMANT